MKPTGAPALRPQGIRAPATTCMVDFHACGTDYHRCLPAWVEARRKRCECGNVLRPCSKCDDNKPMVQFTMGETVRKTGLGVVPAKFDSGSEHVMTRAHRSEPLATGGLSYFPSAGECHGVLETARCERREDSCAKPTRGLGRGAILSRSRPPMVTPIASGLGTLVSPPSKFPDRSLGDDAIAAV